jgi:transposase
MNTPQDEKSRYLKSVGALHAHPRQIRDEAFQQSEFFDPRDLAQVRYEMLRRHRVEGKSVATVARAFGVSRQTYYRVASAFQEHGMCGLLPEKRGPKAPHKCSQAVLQFLAAQRMRGPNLSWSELADRVEAAFGIRVHPRTLERQWGSRKKNRCHRRAR